MEKLNFHCKKCGKKEHTIEMSNHQLCKSCYDAGLFLIEEAKKKKINGGGLMALFVNCPKCGAEDMIRIFSNEDFKEFQSFIGLMCVECGYFVQAWNKK